MRRLLPWALLGLLGAGVATGAALGQVETPGTTITPAAWVGNVLTTTSAVGTAHLRFSTVASSPDATLRSTEVGTGVVDFTTGSYRVTQVNHQIDLESTNGGPTEPKAQTWTEFVVAIGQTMYRDDFVDVPGLTLPVSWVKSHFPRHTHQAFGLDAGTDAENAVAGLAGITPVASVQELGPGTAGGVPATRYLVTDAPLHVCAPSGVAGFLAPLVRPTTIWVDGQGRLVQARVSNSISSQESAALRKLVGAAAAPAAPVTDVTTLTFSDFGAPVRVVAPTTGGPTPKSFAILGNASSRACGG